jgi:hypothetical protein
MRPLWSVCVLSQANALSGTGFAVAVDALGRVWTWGEVLNLILDLLALLVQKYKN